MKYLKPFFIIILFIVVASCTANEINKDLGTRIEPAETGNSTDSGIHGTATGKNYSDSIALKSDSLSRPAPSDSNQ